MPRGNYCLSANSLLKSILRALIPMFYRDMKNISNKFHQGALTIIFFGGDFAGQALKLEKLDRLSQVSIHLHPCHSLQKNDREQFQCLTVVLNKNKK